MSQYLKPRRGKYTSAETQNIVLKKGEMFLCMVNNDDMGRGTGAVYIGDGGTEFNDYAHNGSTASNVPQPFLVHPANYKPMFANSNPSTASYQIDPAVTEINEIGDGKANKLLPQIIGKVKEVLCKHADSINKLSSDNNTIEDILEHQTELISTLSSEVTNMKSKLDEMYPVGSIYISIHNTNPGTFLGGTWEPLAANYVLKTVDTNTAAGNTSAAGNTGSTTLNVNQIPSHSHGIPTLKGETTSDGEHTHTYSYPTWQNETPWMPTGYVNSDTGYGMKNKYENDNVGGFGGVHGHSIKTDPSVTVEKGGNEAHSHTAGMPANIGVHVWRKTSMD